MRQHIYHTNMCCRLTSLHLGWKSSYVKSPASMSRVAGGGLARFPFSLRNHSPNASTKGQSSFPTPFWGGWTGGM